RRHTRFSRDWSSDVCSSDLARAAPAEPSAGALLARGEPEAALAALAQASERSPELELTRARASRMLGDPADAVAALEPLVAQRRSEERRVGKGCRSARAP